jgi:hypothetical protein
MSSRRPIRPKDIMNPDRILSNLLRDYVDGNLDDAGVLYRASVEKVDLVGGQLESDPPNPRNSIQARIISNARDKNTTAKELPVFWPIFSHNIMPIKEGEHVYVLFEDNEEKSHGLWLARIPEPLNVDNKNLTPGIKKYEEDSSNDFSSISAEQVVQDTDNDPGTAPTSPEFVAEPVKRFRARVGSHVIEGSNNTIIVLDRDRPSDINSGHTTAAGTIDLVAGRSVEDDMNFADDKSRVYISSQTDPDANLNIKNDPGPAVDAQAAIIFKSDQIRIIARKGMKVVVEGGDLHLEGSNIFLGKNATEAVMKGNKFNSLWRQVLKLIANHNHPSPVPNAPSPALASLVTPAKSDLNSQASGPVLSKTVKVKG